eukprot:700355-Rhodomonas_salina.1
MVLCVGGTWTFCRSSKACGATCRVTYTSAEPASVPVESPTYQHSPRQYRTWRSTRHIAQVSTVRGTPHAYARTGDCIADSGITLLLSTGLEAARRSPGSSIPSFSTGHRIGHA